MRIFVLLGAARRSLKGDPQVGSFMFYNLRFSILRYHLRVSNVTSLIFFSLDQFFSYRSKSHIYEMRCRSKPVKRARFLFSFKMAASLRRSRGVQLHLLGHPRELYLHHPSFHPSTYSTTLVFHSVHAFKSPPIHISTE